MAKKKSESKFSDLMASRRADAPPPEEMKVAKRNSDEYVKANFYLPKDLYKRLKALSVELEQDMGDLTAQALEEWLAQNPRL
ncbi:hypothetical protein [Allocoleopsis sp.]|uniref:hypothetical protein n=1 Tax=Allocoleopsis sp. TaxID=3088169 RepID=UPI002FD41E37